MENHSAYVELLRRGYVVTVGRAGKKKLTLYAKKEENCSMCRWPIFLPLKIQ